MSRPRARLHGGTRSTLRDWLARPRYEVLPTPGIVDEVAAHVPTTASVTVTASPTRGLEATLRTAEQLAELGLPVVPHLAARQLRDEEQLKEVADRLSRVRISGVFAVAGDADQPAGIFDGAVDLLEALARVAPGLEVGVTGYPESHPRIPDDVTIQAMWDKRYYASYIVSQICFDPRVVLRWTTRIRARGIRMPVLVGVPGPVSTSRLLRVASDIGVGASLRFLAGNRGMVRLARPGPYDPLPLLRDLAAPERGSQDVAGVHVYTFNAIEQTERWRRSLLEELSEPSRPRASAGGVGARRSSKPRSGEPASTSDGRVVAERAGSASDRRLARTEQREAAG